MKREGVKWLIKKYISRGVSKYILNTSWIVTTSKESTHKTANEIKNI